MDHGELIVVCGSWCADRDSYDTERGCVVFPFHPMMSGDNDVVCSVCLNVSP